MILKIKAPAKINLFLDIVNKRDDGYHNIRSIMQSVSLSDELIFDYSDGINVSSDNDLLLNDESNLCYKAAKAFYASSNLKPGISIFIKKNIPISSGLAGGSTDAAATLRGLNIIYNYPLNDTEILNIASKIGADVPFCYSCGTFLCEGIGEKLTRLHNYKKSIVLIARGGEGVSTPFAYKELDKYPEMFNNINRYNDFINNINNNSEKYMYNIFESVILNSHSCAKIIKDELSKFNPKVVMLSGSGPAIFSIFSNMKDAEMAKQHIENLKYKAFICETINNIGDIK